MKILYVNSLFGENARGGAEKIVLYLANGMSERGHDVTVLCLHNLRKPSVEVMKNFRVYRSPLKNLYWPFSNFVPSNIQKSIWHIIDSYNFANIKIVRDFLQCNEFDIVHIHNISGFSASIIAILKKKSKVVLTIHDYYFACFKSTMFKNLHNCERQCLSCKLITLPRKLSSQDLDLVIGVSNFVIDRLKTIGYFKNSTVRIVNNVLHESEFTEIADTYVNNEILKKIKQPFKVGFIGRITEEKGFESVLRAIEYFKEYNMEFFIAGAGNLDLIEKITQMYSDKVRYLGFIESKSFYKMIDVILVPSLWHDPYPTVILEAIGNNVKIIGRDVGGIAEAIGSSAGSSLFRDDQSMLQELKDMYNKHQSIGVFPSGQAKRVLSLNDWLDLHESIYEKYSKK